MYDKALVLEILQQLHTATATILQRFEPVKSVEDFTGSSSGIEKLDSICMLLIATGESLKNLDKITAGVLLSQYPQIDWKEAKGLRCGMLSVIVTSMWMLRRFFTYVQHILESCARHATKSLGGQKGIEMV